MRSAQFECWFALKLATLFCGVSACLVPLSIVAAEPLISIGFDAQSVDQIQTGAGQPTVVGNVQLVDSGPTSSSYPGNPEVNSALKFGKRGAYLRIADHNDLDFRNGDSITLEAWVSPVSLASGSHAYVISKGRTYETERLENHNFALRLTGKSGDALPSFLFSSETESGKAEYHRWTARSGFAVDGGWHHVAITYQFGVSRSLCCVVDSREVYGTWDMGGSTSAEPIVSDEAVWIGSSRGGDPNNSLDGRIDNVRLYREELPADSLMKRWRYRPTAPEMPVADGSLLDDEVLMVLREGAGSHSHFPIRLPEESLRLQSERLLLHRLPVNYSTGGIRQLWDGPVLLQAFMRKRVPAGEYELLLRSAGKSRLWVDGKVVLETNAKRLHPDAHNPMKVYQADIPWLRPPQVGDQEMRTKIALTSAPHNMILESLVGSSSTRCEPGETLVAIRGDEGMFRVLTPASNDAKVELTNDSVEDYLSEFDARLDQFDAARLAASSAERDGIWEQRHASARASVLARRGKFDLPARLRKLATGPAADPLAWLRRLSLDTRGVPPTLEEIRLFLATSEKTRRSVFVDRFLDDPRWADHWTSYWQDALAENPNILKPSLNNTGPFRLWIHDALRLNKPLDRFATELIRMQGDVQAGGPAGFSMAADNDVPMAEKAHIVSSAFLGVNMKCARCHDAPYHPWTQRDLFEIAAMLKQADIRVPESSSVPATFFASHDDAPISVTLQPGSWVAPAFPMHLLQDDVTHESRPTVDSSNRSRLADRITSVENSRFPKVMANRIWTRLFGWGLVDSPDDWFDAEVRNEGLLQDLADTLIVCGYDAKALTKSLLLSDIYSCKAIDSSAGERDERYSAVWQRRMTAEQLIDSMHFTCGKTLETEALTFDGEASQKVQNFLNLGPARRAWQLTSLSNERDRPSLSLPKATAVSECMEAFGWKGARQSPHSERPTEANVVQPGVVANGHLTGWITRMTDESAILDIATACETPEQFVDSLFLSVLTRKPTDLEREAFALQLSEGFDERIVKVEMSPGLPPVHRGFVTWSNHFDVDANLLRRDQERELAEGPMPTSRIAPRWRERAEDALWALINAPEFQLVQ